MTRTEAIAKAIYHLERAETLGKDWRLSEIKIAKTYLDLATLLPPD